jgi:hypothetical protein
MAFEVIAYIHAEQPGLGLQIVSLQSVTGLYVMWLIYTNIPMYNIDINNCSAYHKEFRTLGSF